MWRHAMMAATTLACLACSQAARAQELQATFLGNEIPYDFDRGRNTGVLQRDRPEYSALGITAGAFDIFPRLETGIGYLDNVFGVRNGKTADGYFIIDPSVSGRSDWSRNAVSFNAGARLREFFSQGTENEEGAFANVDGRLDVNADNTIYGGAQVQRAYEERSEGGYPVGAAAPVQFVQSGGYLRAAHEGGRLKLIGAGDVNHFSFDDVPAQGGGSIFQGDRNRTVVRGSSRAEFGLTPDASVLGQFTYTRTDYDQNLQGGLANRNSDEYKLLAGGSVDLTALVRGQLTLGYVSRQFDSGIYHDLSGFAADARLEYFPTQQTTVTLSGRRLIEDSFFVGSGGYFNNGIDLRVDHELLYNLLLDAEVDYERDIYDQTDRKDDIVSVGGGARYFFTREIGLGGFFSYTNRNSTGSLAGVVFDETRFTVSLVFQR